MEDRSGQVWAVAIIFLVITWLTLSLRIWLWWFCEIFYVLASTWLKQAVGVFLLRVAAKKTHILILRAMMIASAFFGTLYFLVVLLQCRPISTFWDDSPGADKCIPSRIIIGLTYTAGCLNAIADWTFGILPIFIVRDLPMSKKAKILVAGLLAFAAIGSTATVVRIPFTSSLGETEDFLWTTTDIAIWSTVEPGIGISAGCIATLRPLFQMFLHHVGLSSSSRPGSSMRLGSRRPDLGYRGHRSRDVENPPRSNGMIGTVTTITSQKGGAPQVGGGSWEERIGREGSEDEIVGKAGAGGIGKSVFVMYEEERRNSTREGAAEGAGDAFDRWDPIKQSRV
ncbi:hypothetical protein H2199_005702 [Coniosporium tulheliwenetii]|uniref:Uncharacterized protein n=1 Tax=Coniosporium tulheliwenetii TaxID=3383036 RepID=A0ACC2Z0T4_9PEZI|nr:hypothetical protein H2199_005702 [Cladosporium sp. JES 115]